MPITPFLAHVTKIPGPDQLRTRLVFDEAKRLGTNTSTLGAEQRA